MEPSKIRLSLFTQRCIIPMDGSVLKVHDLPQFNPLVYPECSLKNTVRSLNLFLTFQTISVLTSTLC